MDIFLDYVPFLKDYRVLTREYVSVQRIWPKVPIYFEIDGFLDYLFRHHPKRPTKRFEKDPPRNLSKADRPREIRALAKQFKDWADREKKDGRSSVSHSRLVRRLLSRRNIKVLTRAQIREVVAGLNCMNDPRQRARFLKSSQNSTAAIRTSWEGLLFGTQPDTERMSLCANRLFSFKRSSVQTRS